MAVRRIPNTWSLIDVFDCVLDKGIVIDAWVRMSLVGIDLLTVEARIVVASLATYLTYADALAESTSGFTLRRRQCSPNTARGLASSHS